MNNVSYFATDSEIVLVFPSSGKSVSIHRSHENWTRILEAVRTNKSEEEILKLADTVSAFRDYIFERGLEVRFENGQVIYDGKPVHNVVVDRIVSHSKLGLDPAPLVKFLGRLFRNPSMTAVDELYLFLESTRMPIGEDGCFLAYKAVRADYLDKHSGTVSNKPGTVVTMPRNNVDDNRQNFCSRGLHFAGYDYIKSAYYSPGDRIVVVAIDPSDVVSIPADYNNQKGRTSKYTVIEDVTDKFVAAGDFMACNYSDSDCDDYRDDPRNDPAVFEEYCNYVKLGGDLGFDQWITDEF